MNTLSNNRPFIHRLVLVTAALFLTTCQEPVIVEEFRLPISINQLMASLIDHAADPIWVAAWNNPQSARDWRELEHLSRQLQVGGALLTIPGSGPIDLQWTGRDAWQEYSMQLSDAAARAVDAARSKDVELIGRTGDEIVDICESCHIDFMPDIPTMNIYGELSPTAVNIED